MEKFVSILLELEPALGSNALFDMLKSANFSRMELANTDLTAVFLISKFLGSLNRVSLQTPGMKIEVSLLISNSRNAHLLQLEKR